MRLTPRYEGDPILRIDTQLGDVAVPMARQRARFADLLAGLDADQWAAPSRCAEWSVQDVVAHLAGVNRFWVASITAGLAGEPTRVLESFDPVSTPAAMVAAVRGWSASEALDHFVASNDALAAVVSDLDDDAWATLAEAPPGHIGLRAVVLHALWDAWVHERDVALPLGITTAEEADEIAGCLQYACALGPAFLATGGSTRRATLHVRATDPDVAFVVDVRPDVVVHDGPVDRDAHTLEGPAVDLVEALSFRIPLDDVVGADDQWMFGGLAAAFDLV